MTSQNNDTSLIYGKNELKNIVSVEVEDSNLVTFIETPEGIKTDILKNEFWLLCNKQLSSEWVKLKGDLHYRYGKKYKTKDEWLSDRSNLRRYDITCVYDEKDSALVKHGVTYFKGMTVADVSVLSFDIETTTLNHDDNADVILISNTYRKNGKVEHKLFSYDEYKNTREMIDAWCAWVREKNPSFMIGHNIFLFDIPYLNFVAQANGTTLKLGRDGSDIKIDTRRPAKFRRDGTQFYEYFRSNVYGRELIDTFFVSIKYDFSRKYNSYNLKNIIKEEGLEAEDRQFYDASTIRHNYRNKEEFQKIKQYCIHDSDDALKLYDLMIPSYFYLTQSIPKAFQNIINTASGSWLNLWLIRSYLQDGHSIPKETEAAKYEGATSFGNPGIYKNVFKIDVASLYPSIMRNYKVYDQAKDPKQHFFKMVETFTLERLKNKELGKTTGDRYYNDLQEAQKIVINSAYGLLGAPGLHFNSPNNAAFVTGTGRDILDKSINWAKSKGFFVVNADTDSIAITNNTVIDKDQRKALLNDLNALYPSIIRFEDDGYYSHFVVLRTKNYAIKSETGKVKIKGSALKGATKEPALKQMMNEIVNLMLLDSYKEEDVLTVYNTYLHKIKNISSKEEMKEWCSKKTITDKVLNPERSNEQKIKDALIDEEDLTMGDKRHFYFRADKTLCLVDNFKNDHDIYRLAEKIFKTLAIFENVLDKTKFINYSLKRQRDRFERLIS